MIALNKYDPLTRNKLLDSYIQGMVDKDKNSLINLYELTKEIVFGFILSIIKNKCDAEDIFQEVYIKLYENCEKYNSQGKPLAWIMTVTKNLCYENLRNKKDVSDIDEMHNVGAYDKNNKNVEDKIILDIVFNKITEEERNIIILHVVSGMKYREIADYLNLPLSTVLSKYHRAIKRMKDLLKEDVR